MRPWMIVPVRNEPDAAPACQASTDIHPEPQLLTIDKGNRYTRRLTSGVTERFLITRRRKL